MGVYVKGMEMPKPGVYTCELGVLDDNTAVLTIYTPINEPQKSYTLIPVQTHGRLIDADALEQEAQERLLECDKYDNQFQKPYEIMRAIRVAPVIIPADMEWKMKNYCCCDDKTIIPAEEGE